MSAWRLGLDLGTGSIGWVVLELDKDSVPCSIQDMGVRSFPDGREPAGVDLKTGLPKIGESLAVARRMAHGLRKNRDRRLNRVRLLAEKLIKYGLLPEDKNKRNSLFVKLNPYKARNDAATGPVSKAEIARAMFHICKRRGFQSNRKTDSDAETRKLKLKMNNLETILEKNGLTLGQYLWKRLSEKGEHVRFRGEEYHGEGENKKAIYPKRSMYQKELDVIRQRQGNKYIPDEQWDELVSIIMFQRPLKPSKPGTCTFENGEGGRQAQPRASRQLPIAHTYRIVQEVNNLNYRSGTSNKELTAEQRQKLYTALENQKSLSFSKIRTRLFKLDKDSRFNLESERRKDLKGNVTSCDMRALFSKHNIDWDKMDSSLQNDVVQMILDANELTDLLTANREHGWNFPPEIVRDLSKYHFSSSHGHISRVCMEKLLPLMRGKGLQYWQAAREIYGDHTDYSHFATGEVLEELPYYGQVLKGATAPVKVTKNTPDEEEKYGRIPNPTVHVALNQLRKLVNALIKRYGNPEQVHIELARQLKMAGKRYDDFMSEIKKNTDKNKKRKETFIECFKQEPTGIDLLKMRLWEELGESDFDDGFGTMLRRDIYTGKNISFTQLFSDEIEIEHILPFSKTYDNSTSNKTVTFREVNRRKGDQLPYAFALLDNKIDPAGMLERSKNLPKGKVWRFQEDAMDIYERIIFKRMPDAEKQQYAVEKDGAFIDRQLVDTQYISRIAARYLVPVVGEPSRIVPVNGKITGLLRNKWNMDSCKRKGQPGERQDHRHHAVDALVVALTDRAMIKRIADETREKQAARNKSEAKLYVPRPKWLTQETINKAVEAIYVSFRPDHSHESRLYAETAYGLLPADSPLRKEGYHGVVRRNLKQLKETEVEQIRDPDIQAAFYNFLHRPEIMSIKKWEDKLKIVIQEGMRVCGKRIRLRKIRILVKNQSIKAIKSSPNKGYVIDSFAFCDIWKVPKTNKKRAFTGKHTYKGVFIDYVTAKEFEKNESGLMKKYKPHPAAKKIMRLYKYDSVMLKNADGQEQLMRIAGFGTTQNKLDIQPHTLSGGKQNHISINTLMSQEMRKVIVTIDGRVI